MKTYFNIGYFCSPLNTQNNHGYNYKMRSTPFIFMLAILFSTSCKATIYRISDRIINDINRTSLQNQKDFPEAVTKTSPDNYPLFNAYPTLQDKLPMVPLCNCPTPVSRLHTIENAIDGKSKNIKIYVKQDGQTNTAIYGGNKVRKLELLMAQALFSGKKTMLITGTAGSNSVVATALFAKRLGIAPEIHLAPQLPSEQVKTNLLTLARIMQMPTQRNPDRGLISYHNSTARIFKLVFRKILFAPFSKAPLPFICPPGATTPLTTIAYINAMYELLEDVEQGRLAKIPSKIFVPAGSGGTFIGLLIGKKLLPQFSNTALIAVTSGSKRPTEQYLRHAQEVTAYLQVASKQTHAPLSFTENELDNLIDRSFAAGGYGEITPNGEEAMALATEDNLKTEHTYTAKTIARLIHDGRQAKKQKEVEIWLYWHTHNSDGKQYNTLTKGPITEEDMQTLKAFLNKKQLEMYGFVPQNDENQKK